jgi:menaquinone-specific isochorismate synthase
MTQDFRPDHRPLLARLRRRLEEIVSRHAGDEEGLLSITLATPELRFDGLPPESRGCVYWSEPRTQHSLLGMGEAADIAAEGPDRFVALDAGYAALRRTWTRVDADRLDLSPKVFAGFAFDADGIAGEEFPNARLAVPSVLLQRKGDVCAATFTVDRGQPDWRHVVGIWLARAGQLFCGVSRRTSSPRGAGPLIRQENDPRDEEWLGRVHRALGEIEAGRLSKVVLSRRVRVAAPQPFDPAAVAAFLGTRYPECIQFAYGDRSGRVLLGATPECLVALHGREVISDALAGTAWQAADSLLGDEKAAREQWLVVESIAEALRPFCIRLDIPPRPEMLRLRHLQHLWSRIRGEVRPEASLLGLVAKVHPTPAVGGVPTPEAMAWLKQQGDIRRAWYTGAIGWLDTEGEGEFHVVLRCALLDRHRADVFAGAGIVAGSDPRKELAETEMKLNAMLEALEGSCTGEGRECTEGIEALPGRQVGRA